MRVHVGLASLLIPPGFDGNLLSTPDCPVNCAVFAEDSPETTIYHSRPYIDFARHENGAGDLLVVRSEGTPLFGIPVHPDSHARWISTGYSGVLFPNTSREAVLRASVSAFERFIKLNRSLGFRIEQSAQAPAYASAARITLLAQLLWNHRNQVRPTYTRVLELTGQIASSGIFADDMNAASLENHLLTQYDGDIRNQIRQAIRRGLRMQVFSLDSASSTSDTLEVYRRYLPVQTESYRRTGMSTHSLDYWTGLSRAVQSGGGTDVVVLITDETGVDVAGVTCHLFRGRAIYWSGASTAAGKSARANPLALHAAITACAASGCAAFELGRFDASEQSEKECAITRYKAQFRGQLSPVVNFARPPQTPRNRLGMLARRIRARVERMAIAPH